MASKRGITFQAVESDLNNTFAKRNMFWSINCK